MTDVAWLIRIYFEGIVTWTQPRKTNGLLEVLNGRFQVAERRARGWTSFEGMRTVLFRIAGRLDFARINPHAAEPT